MEEKPYRSLGEVLIERIAPHERNRARFRSRPGYELCLRQVGTGSRGLSVHPRNRIELVRPEVLPRGVQSSKRPGQNVSSRSASPSSRPSMQPSTSTATRTCCGEQWTARSPSATATGWAPSTSATRRRSGSSYSGAVRGGSRTFGTRGSKSCDSSRCGGKNGRVARDGLPQGSVRDREPMVAWWRSGIRRTSATLGSGRTATALRQVRSKQHRRHHPVFTC